MLGVASYAQQDTTKTGIQIQQSTATPQPVLPVTPQVAPQVSPNQPGVPGWTPVNSQTMPDNLKQTLNTSPQYKGWESGTMYTNPAQDTYQLRTNDINPQVYYFDKDGKLVTKPNDH